MQIIGDADDLMDADGEKILSFDQAQEKARALVAKQRPNLYRRSSHRRLRPSYRRPRDGSPHRRPARSTHVPASMKAKPVDEPHQARGDELASRSREDATACSTESRWRAILSRRGYEQPGDDQAAEGHGERSPVQAF